MKILNLGCGNKTSPDPSVFNIDFSIRLQIKKNPLLNIIARKIVPSERMARIDSLPENIMVHDLRKGIPFADDSIDVVFHSHLIEHIDRDRVEDFIIETKRVLKPGGILRIACPDFEELCRDYLAHLNLCNDEREADKHEEYIAAIIEQIATRESRTTRNQSPILRKIENIIVGDARRKGEAHMWMYDRITLPQILLKNGFCKPEVVNFDQSNIPNWSNYKIDINDDGSEYKTDSFYVEATKA